MSATSTAVFAAFTFVPPTTDVLQHRASTLAVAIAATCSWLCCVVLLGWISYLLFSMYRKQQKQETASRYAFLRTQFGLLFANLLVADLIQSTAFAINYYWYFTQKRPLASVSPVCTFQALGIQSGDLASAIWSFIIALHTITFLVWRYKVPNKVAVATVPVVWSLVIIMTSLGPIHVRVLRQGGGTAGPFYNNAGLWCWIGIEYEPWRVYNHYMFVFISAFGSLTMYGGVFLYLWFRLFQRGMYNHQLFQLRRAADGRIVPTSPTPVLENRATFADVLPRHDSEEAGGDVEKGGPLDTAAMPASAPTKAARIKQRVKDKHAAERNRKVDKAALLMLLFPACYILSILPLASFRLARISKQPWSYNLDVQAGCGFLFALGGTFNAILYALTRKIFQSSGKGSSSPYDSGRGSVSAGPSTGGAISAPAFSVNLEAANGQPTTLEKARKASWSNSIAESSHSAPFPTGQNVGKTSYNPWQPAAMLFGRKNSSDSHRRRNSSSPSRDGEPVRTDRNYSMVSSSVGGRPSIVRKPSGLGQSVHFASGHQGKMRDDGTWDDGLSFEDSTDGGHSIYENSQEEIEEEPTPQAEEPTYAPILTTESISPLSEQTETEAVPPLQVPDAQLRHESA